MSNLLLEDVLIRNKAKLVACKEIAKHVNADDFTTIELKVLRHLISNGQRVLAVQWIRECYVFADVEGEDEVPHLSMSTVNELIKLIA